MILKDTQRGPIGRTMLLAAVAALTASTPAAFAGDFSVSPIRAELKPGAMSETVTVTNHADKPLRVGVRLMSWTQDESGNDVLRESGDLVYFPRQLDFEPSGKRLVRVGAKSPAAATERAYRLFIEEAPSPLGDDQRGAQVAVYFKFGVPIFLPPAVPKLQADFSEPTVDKGQLAVQVRNTGNVHFRLTTMKLEDGAGFSTNVGGWYMLPGTTRKYVAAIPAEVCRKAPRLLLTAEGDGVHYTRDIPITPANCS